MSQMKIDSVDKSLLVLESTGSHIDLFDTAIDALSRTVADFQYHCMLEFKYMRAQTTFRIDSKKAELAANFFSRFEMNAETKLSHLSRSV